MPIPEKLNIPNYPRFLFAPDSQTMELYIICTKPLTLFWVRQTIPAQIYIIEGKPNVQLLRECGFWYRNNAANLSTNVN